MALSQIITGIQSDPFRFLLHGVEGVGKTTCAAKAPYPIFVTTEDGAGRIDVPKFPIAESFDDVISNLNSLLTEQHSYSTVVVDSIDWLEKLAVQQILEGNPQAKTLADFGYGQGYARLIPLFEQVIDMLNQLRRKKAMNIVLISHSKMEKIEDPSGGAYDQSSPRLDKRINGLVREWVDIIGFATYAITKVEEKSGFNTRTVAKPVKDADGNDRVLFLESTPAIVAKNRYSGMPNKMPLDGEAFFAALWNTIHPSK
jgi:hypothetical protein